MHILFRSSIAIVATIIYPLSIFVGLIVSGLGYNFNPFYFIYQNPYIAVGSLAAYLMTGYLYTVIVWYYYVKFSTKQYLLLHSRYYSVENVLNTRYGYKSIPVEAEKYTHELIVNVLCWPLMFLFVPVYGVLLLLYFVYRNIFSIFDNISKTAYNEVVEKK